MVQLHHSLLQLACLVGRKAEVADVVGAMFLGLVVSQFSLDSVGAQKGVGDKRAGQTTGQDVVPQLQAQVVPKETQKCCTLVYRETSGRSTVGLFSYVRDSNVCVSISFGPD